MDAAAAEVRRCVDVVVGSAQDGALVDRVTGELCNRPPVADAQAAGEVFVGSQVALDGSASSDPDGDSLAYRWTLTAPDGSAAALDDAASPTPVFTPDRHGTYSATLTVDDGRQTATDAVTVATTNRAPTANAGPDTTVRADDPAHLDGSVSSDPDGDPLAYEWAIVAAPAGSAAVIDDAGSARPTLVPDALGDYAVELTVSDGEHSSTDTVVVTATHVVTLWLTPEVTRTQTFRSSTLHVLIDRPAGAGGRIVGLVSDRPEIASVPPSVAIPAGATSAPVPVTTSASGGAAIITASSDRSGSDQATVDVALRSMAIELTDGLVGIGRTNPALVRLEAPAPAGGIVVALESSDPGRVSVSPAEVAVPEGGTTAEFSVTGVSEGSVVLRASAPGHADADAATAGTDALVSIGSVAPMSPAESRSLPISLTHPAPPGGVTVTLSSSDPSIASVPASVTIPEGRVLPAANPQVAGHRVGTVTVTARTQGYAPDDRAVTVRLILTLSPNPARVIVGRTATMTLALSGPAPPGGLTVALASSDPAKATAPASIVVPAGQTTAPFGVTGVAVGSGSVTASAEGAASVTVPVTVDPVPVISAPNAAVGIDLQQAHSVSLSAPPDGPVDMTVTVADPSIAAVAASRTAAGSGSLTFAGVENTSGRTLWVQGLTRGSTTYTVSAPGNQSVTRTIDVTPSGVAILTNSPLSTSTFSPNVPIDVRVLRLSSAGAYQAEQEPRAGLQIAVEVTSSNPSAAAVVNSPLTFSAGGGNIGQAQLDPAAAGTTTVAVVQPTGFTAPTTFRTAITVNVAAPSINTSPVAVGFGLQHPQTIQLAQPPPSPVDVTITVADESIALVSTSRTAVGGATATFAGVGDANSRTLWFQGVALGSTTYTVSAPGYQTRTLALDVTPSGVAILSNSPQNLTTFSPHVPIDVRTLRLSSTGAFQAEQEPRAGQPLSVSLTSSNSAVVTVANSPLTFSAGGGNIRTALLDASEPGTATVSVVQPEGFTATTTFNTKVTVNVTAPPINAGPADIGFDLQQQHTVSLSQSPPSPVDLTITVADPSIAVVSTSRTGVGAASATLTGLTSTAGRNVWFQGLAQGSTTYTVSAPGYQTRTIAVNVTPSGVAILSAPLSTTTFSPNRQVDVRTLRLDSGGAFQAEQEPRAGRPLSVDVTSSNPDVAEVVNSPLTFKAGSGNIAAAHVDPITAGTTTVALVQPSGFIATTTFKTAIAVTVRPPAIVLANTAVGRDLQQAVAVTLEAAPPEPVTITIEVASDAIGVISKSRTTLGGSSLTFANVTTTNVGTIYVQGLDLGATTMLAQAAGYADQRSDLTVTPAGVAILGGSFSVASTAANRGIDVRTLRLDSNRTFQAEQEPRPGRTVSVTVTSSNPGAGVITNSPLTFTAGGGNIRSATFDPQAPGQTTVSVAQPPGFEPPVTFPTAITVTVT